MAKAKSTRKRRPSSKCSKRRPCAVKIGNTYLPAQVKTYAKYGGKAELVLTGLPANVKLIPLRGPSKKAINTTPRGPWSSIGGKAQMSAMKKRAAKAARQLQQAVRAQDAADARRMAGGSAASAAPKRRSKRAA